jgi:hypothetical protein
VAKQSAGRSTSNQAANQRLQMDAARKGFIAVSSAIDRITAWSLAELTDYLKRVYNIGLQIS